MKTIFSSILFLLLACGQNANEKRTKGNSIEKVTVAFSGFGCEGKCPFQALSVNNKFDAFYYGGQFAETKGYYKGRFTQPIWNSIQTRFDKLYYKGIDTTKQFKADLPFVEFYITGDQGKKYFRENAGKMTNEDVNVLYWFIRLRSKAQGLEKCDSLPFETALQYRNYN